MEVEETASPRVATRTQAQNRRGRAIGEGGSVKDAGD